VVKGFSGARQGKARLKFLDIRQYWLALHYTDNNVAFLEEMHFSFAVVFLTAAI
jgi:hypothetical protein